MWTSLMHLKFCNRIHIYDGRKITNSAWFVYPKRWMCIHTIQFYFIFVYYVNYKTKTTRIVPQWNISIWLDNYAVYTECFTNIIWSDISRTTRGFIDATVYNCMDSILSRGYVSSLIINSSFLIKYHIVKFIYKRKDVSNH